MEKLTRKNQAHTFKSNQIDLKHSVKLGLIILKILGTCTSIHKLEDHAHNIINA